MTTLPGVKAEHSKRYITESLHLAEKNYDLALDSREYVAFKTKINSKDFIKVKDFIRNLRQSAYEMGATAETDSVVHFNINAFLLKTTSTEEAKLSN